MQFSDLNINTQIIRALREINITEATPIQEKTIPILQAGEDIVGISKTGSGKTLAFCAPIIEKIEPQKHIQALIVVPIRELAQQIYQEIKKFSKYLPVNVALVYGGLSMQPQVQNLKTAQIVVGTPGRLTDHLRRRTINFSSLRFLVLDEADKMVEMGFIQDIVEIINHLPKKRQTMLFGATISDEILMLKSRYMNNPKTIKLQAHVEEELLDQYYYDLQPGEKFSYLVHLLRKETSKLVIIFCNTRHQTDNLSKNLKKQGLDAKAIHGGLSQNKRLEVISGFHKGRPVILVATAVAARGLDIKNVTHIYNYDLPKDSQEYIHRIGRTARAGEKGMAITLLTDRDHEFFRAILGRYPIKIQKLDKERFQRVSYDSGKRHFDRRGSNRSFDRRPNLKARYIRR